MTKEIKSYIAGFLDGDGSIYVRLKPNSTYRYGFQVSPSIVFFQSSKEVQYLHWMRKILKRGYVRQRNDGVAEYIIGDRESLLWLIDELTPYLRLKKSQAKLMKKILVMQKEVKSGKDFLCLSKEIDRFGEMNYSKKRIQNSLAVKKTLKEEGLLTP